MAQLVWTLKLEVANPKHTCSLEQCDDVEGVSIFNLGFEHGATVVQDGRNILPTENLTFKIVSWAESGDCCSVEMEHLPAGCRGGFIPNHLQCPTLKSKRGSGRR